MFKLVKELFFLLTPSQRKGFYTLQLLVVLMALMEIIGIASIIPFMALVGDMSLLEKKTFIAELYKYSGIASASDFVFLVGAVVLVMLFLSAVISMFTLWRLFMFANRTGTEIADRLYSHYLRQSWLFHASGSSAQLTKKIATETRRITTGVLMPLMQMNARVVFAVMMTITIFIYDPVVAVFGLAAFTIAYLILFKVVRIRLQNNGELMTKLNEQRFRLMNEGFGGIKDILLLGRGNHFINRFNQTGQSFAYSEGSNQSLSQVPRYFVELVAFGSMIALVLYLIATHDGNLGVILPVLSVYALAGFKLLPAFQLIYFSLATMKGNISAFESIRNDLAESDKNNIKFLKSKEGYMKLRDEILLQDITFTYPRKSESTLNNLNMSIPANSTIGIVGPSGSGKSTLIDIILGLIEPHSGQLKVDNTTISSTNRRSWQNTIGFVAQSIFISEGTIAENVAFGIPPNEIDIDQVQQVLKLAHLSELLDDLDQGVHTKVGERGVQLSGGQRQRIGIARALYHEAEVLVFDEATSSLDGVTEKMIMQAIHDFSGQKTIILIAHRLKTVQKCDKIYFVDKGKVADEGTYQQLIKSNEHFKNMAAHA